MPVEKDLRRISGRTYRSRPPRIRGGWPLSPCWVPRPRPRTRCRKSWACAWRQADTSAVGNLTGWLTIVVARIALDMLRQPQGAPRRSRDPARGRACNGCRTRCGTRARRRDPGCHAGGAGGAGACPAHRFRRCMNMFDLPFDDIAPIVGRTTVATRQLASRARRRVQGAPKKRRAPIARWGQAFLTPLHRQGDFEGLC